MDQRQNHNLKNTIINMVSLGNQVVWDPKKARLSPMGDETWELTKLRQRKGEGGAWCLVNSFKEIPKARS